MNNPLDKSVQSEVDKILAEYQIGFVVADKDVNEHLAKFKQAIQKLINQAIVEELETIIKRMPTFNYYKTADQAIYKATLARIKELRSK